MSPDRYGVIGHPVAHSRSPFIHERFAAETGHDMTYERFDVPPEAFTATVRELLDDGVRGLNVTVPHKPAAAALADRLTPRAERAAAVNTLAVQRDGSVLGDNTDGVGLVRDLLDNLGIELAGRRVLLLGAGGAARGVVGPLLELGLAELAIANRTAASAHALAALYADAGNVRGCGFDGVGPRPWDVVINATSAGLGGARPQVSTAIVGTGTVCYDMVYGRELSPFLRWALAEGAARAEPGWGMLVEQAAESFALWRGVRPSTAPVLEALRAG